MPGRGSCRRRVVWISWLAAGLLATARPSAGDEPAKTPPAPPEQPQKPEPKSDKLRFVEISPSCRAAIQPGGNSNAGIIIGKEAALVVDCLSSPARGEELAREVRRLTDKPIRYAALTHWHYDHSVGDQAFDEDTKIIATEKAAAKLRDRLDKDRLLLGPGSGMHGSVGIVKVRNVTETITTDREIDLGGLVVRLTLTGECHTDGDLAVFVPSEKVLFAGDMVWNAAHPNLAEGSTFKWIAGLAALEKLDVTKVVPGHGEPGDKTLLATQRQYLMTVRRLVKHLAKNKIEPEEIVKQLAVPETYKDHLFPEWWPSNIRFICEEIFNGR